MPSGELMAAGLIAAYLAVALAALAVEAARRLSPARKAHRSAVALAADTLMQRHPADAYAEATRRSSGGEGFAEQVRLEVARRLGLTLGVDVATRMHYRMARRDAPAEPRVRDNRVARFVRDLLTPADARWFAAYDPSADDDRDREQALQLARAYVGATTPPPAPEPVPPAPGGPARPVTLLTRRQRDCLVWAARGKSSTDIAGILNLSPHTVDEHLADACRRLGVRTRVQAVVEASAQGILRAESSTPQA